jgi:hypothetical protein
MPVDPDGGGTEPALASDATTSARTGQGSIKTWLSHLVGGTRPHTESAPESPVAASPDNADAVQSPPVIAQDATAGVTETVATLTNAIRRLTVQVNLHELKARAQTWRMKAVEDELTRARRELEEERARTGKAETNQRYLYEIEISRLNLELSLARTRCHDLARQLAAIRERDAGAGSTRIDRPRDIGETLLADVRTAFDKLQVTRISMSGLVEVLAADALGPWSTCDRGKPISPRQLGRILRAYGIVAKAVRTADGVSKGFERTQFAGAWDRIVRANARWPEAGAGADDGPHGLGRNAAPGRQASDADGT